MTIIIVYRIMVLHGRGLKEIPLEIRVNRDEDIFEMWVGDNQVAFGDWDDNLLQNLEKIVDTETKLAS